MEVVACVLALVTAAWIFIDFVKSVKDEIDKHDKK